jgi:L-seryl-tRNA(Ser) seleniumtransferase
VAIKPPDLLNRIPSVSELLEKPPIRALAERWNRAVVASGVKSFLDELRTDLERRTADWSLPSVRDLVERAARYVASRQHHALGVAINATGRVWDQPWETIPLADAALERVVAVGREFAVMPDRTNGHSLQAEALLCRLCGAQSAAIVHSYAAGVWMAFASLAATRDVLVARSEVAEISHAHGLPQLAKAAMANLVEVGTIDSALAADYELAASHRAAAVLKVNCDSYRIVGQTSAAELEELVALARERELISIAALGTAPLVDPPPTISWPRRSACASISAGADLVLLRGDGLLGGPSCGILLGSKEVIDRVVAHPLFEAIRLDPPRTAALVATLECYENPTGVIDSIPIWHCLTVSVDNLRNRAERLAPQLAQAGAIASATAVENRSPFATILPDGLPSYGIALVPADGKVIELDRTLRSARFPVFGRIENERIFLDLRTVLPRQDRTLVDALVGSAQSEPQSASEPGAPIGSN